MIYACNPGLENMLQMLQLAAIYGGKHQDEYLTKFPF